MKFAIALESDYKINTSHFGESNYFLIIDWNYPDFFSKEKRTNHYREHETPDKTRKVLKIIDDCDFIVAYGMGRKAIDVIVESGKKILITREKLIPDLMEHLKKSAWGQFKTFDAEKGKFVICTGRPF